MAAVDPIAYSPLCKLFPALTVKQVTNCCFYSLGANYSEVASLQELSATAVRRSLELTQKNLATGTLPGIKSVFWSGFIVRQIVNKYCLHDAHESHSFSCLAPLFPELSLDEITCCLLLSGGNSRNYLTIIVGQPLETVNQLIESAIGKLEVGTEFMLKVFIISRLIVDLT